MGASLEQGAQAPSGPAIADERPSGRAPGMMGAPERAGDELARLIARIAERQDRDAFRALFQSLAPAVKGMLMRQGADAATAEELAQETLLSVWRKARYFAPERGAATTWVFTIARNLRIDRLRREPAWQELTDEQDENVSEEPRPDEALASRQIQERVAAVLSEIPADQSTLVRLAYQEGLSHSQIAARLGVPLGTVKTRMNSAYRKIRAALEGFQ
jgi:RNA polymerase sigma-70 factor (ECF subfamily)